LAILSGGRSVAQTTGYYLTALQAEIRGCVSHRFGINGVVMTQADIFA
jgi:hypothetical protein